MKKYILYLIVLFFIVSFKPEYGDYIMISNYNYNAQLVTIYYDYDDGYWTPIERLNIPGQSNITFNIDTSMLYKYAYKSSNMIEIQQIYSTDIYIY